MNFLKNTFVAFDTETSGGYPIGYDIVEFGAIKWSDGKEIDRMQFLFKPREPMSDFIITIHGIKNEDVAEMPGIQSHIKKIHQFFGEAILIAHHAPFDMGFLAYEFEKASLPILSNPVICTSLLSQKVITDSGNHKLQTLVKHLKIDGGSAHRAFDDARSCLSVALDCFQRMEKTYPHLNLEDVLKKQKKTLLWKDYGLISDNRSVVQNLIRIILEKNNAEIQYQGGSHKGQSRMVKPIGIVRNPDGDYLHAFCLNSRTNKRYYLNKISEVSS